MASGLRGSAALADDAPPFALGAPAPHALLLAEGEGVLEARLADGTLGTDLFGRVGLVVGGRVERHRIEAAARGMLAPGLLHGGGSVPLVTEVGLGVRSASHPRARIGSLCPLGLERKPRGSVQPDSEGTVDNATPSPRWQGCCRPGLWGLTSSFAVSRRHPRRLSTVALGSFDRNDSIARLGEGTFDVLVIGGGITGAGVALDAASRGLRTALVERDDLASGTSSKSSKLVHGGLRYLQNGDVRLVYEALRERQRLLRNAPHLVKVLPFLIPVFEGKGGIISKRVARALGSAMWMYDLTGGLRIGRVHRRLERDAALAHMLTVARTAALDFGATVVNHATVTAIRKSGARVRGAVVSTGGAGTGGDGTDAAGASGEVEVRARAVVNATGVWADDVRALDEGSHPGSIRPAKGIHITVPWHKVRNDIAAVVPVREDPGRSSSCRGPGSTARSAAR